MSFYEIPVLLARSFRKLSRKLGRKLRIFEENSSILTKILKDLDKNSRKTKKAGNSELVGDAEKWPKKAPEIGMSENLCVHLCPMEEEVLRIIPGLQPMRQAVIKRPPMQPRPWC